MNKKIILVITTLILISAGIYYVLYHQRVSLQQEITNFEECAAAGNSIGESYPRQCWTPDGRHFVEKIETSLSPSFGPVTITGEITCLPKIGKGPQTLECAIGLLTTDGDNYGLRNQFDPEYKFSQVGLKVEVKGTLLQEDVTGPDGNKYDISGVIDVTSIKEIED